ncbi:MAG: helix-turn-helix domain-containing protein [Acidobacteriota bacterium]|jgi:excisionase family DNA binding protein
MPLPTDRPDALPLLDQTEAAEFLAVSTRTLEGWRSSGGGPPFVRVGRRVRYRLQDLQEWIGERTFGSTTEVGDQG